MDDLNRHLVRGLQAPGAWWLPLAALAVLWIGRCDDPQSQSVAPRPLTIVISGDTDGWITPCGCTSNQSGGLLRRGTFISGLRKKGDVLYADAGGAVHFNSDYDRLKLDAIVAGEKLMGIVAHNIGRAEASFGPQALRELVRNGVPLVSANLRDVSGQPVAPPLRITATGGKRIAITGVLAGRFAPPQLRVDDPRQAVLAAVGNVKGQYDSLIVLAYLPQDELEQLASALPEADAVVGGPTGQPIAPRQVGPTLLASATNKGKFLAVLNLSNAGASGGRIVEMDGALADQDVQQQNVRRYLDELARHDLSPAQTGLVSSLPAGTPADYQIAGSESCARCHAEELAIWRQTAHARAWQTLLAKHFEVDPQCMQCHTTGYGLPGGFETRAHSAALVSVGCESCHGPSAAHVFNPARRTPFKAADQCTQCHDPENSPRFEYWSYWSKIRHGRSRPGPREAEHATS